MQTIKNALILIINFAKSSSSVPIRWKKQFGAVQTRSLGWLTDALSLTRKSYPSHTQGISAGELGIYIIFHFSPLTTSTGYNIIGCGKRSKWTKIIFSSMLENKVDFVMRINWAMVYSVMAVVGARIAIAALIERKNHETGLMI